MIANFSMAFDAVSHVVMLIGSWSKPKPVARMLPAEAAVKVYPNRTRKIRTDSNRYGYREGGKPRTAADMRKGRLLSLMSRKGVLQGRQVRLGTLYRDGKPYSYPIVL